MIYCIMCGGTYTVWGDTPKQMVEVGGEKLIERTIRLLKAEGCGAICITSNNSDFEQFGVPVLYHHNDYTSVNGKISGYWLDAFFPYFDSGEKVTYIFGDVWFTEVAIHEIVHHQEDEKNILWGSRLAANELGKNWGEPFAYRVNDYRTFMNGVRAVKRMQDNGELNRQGLVWELYRYLNDLDVNTQKVLVGDTFFIIDDGTIDFDDPEQAEQKNRELECL